MGGSERWARVRSNSFAEPQDGDGAGGRCRAGATPRGARRRLIRARARRRGAGSGEGAPASRRTATRNRRATRRPRQLQAKAAPTPPRLPTRMRGALPAAQDGASAEEKCARLPAEDEDVLLNFVADSNKLYQDQLDRPDPFVSFIIGGMPSSGKSTILKRFLNAPLNIVQEGTGTSFSFDTPEEVFAAITEHNRDLGEEDVFSTEPLYLVYRSKNVQNMRCVDTPGIILNVGTGNDNREDIEFILRSTMKKHNSKL